MDIYFLFATMSVYGENIYHNFPYDRYIDKNFT